MCCGPRVVLELRTKDLLDREEGEDEQVDEEKKVAEKRKRD